MEPTMNAVRIKSSLKKLSGYIRFVYPAMGWLFSPVKSDDAISPETGSWACMFSFIEKIAEGNNLCLSSEMPGCSGAACYLGFRKPGQRAGFFLAEKERFKKSIELADAFYEEIHAIPAKDKYLVLGRIDDLKDASVPEVIVLWVNPTALSGLVTLANYDRATNDNVIIPFASGCQGIWTIPYREKFQELPKCVVGLIDPAARIHMPEEVLSFSMPAERFAEMVDNVEGSFLEADTWRRLHKGGGQ